MLWHLYYCFYANSSLGQDHYKFELLKETLSDKALYFKWRRRSQPLLSNTFL